jgi:peptidoglycan/LPS O-acetylase OafA/YrhL
LSARPLVALGQVSFGIYLLHPVAMSLTRNLVDLFALPIASSPVWGALTYVAVFAGTWGLAWVSFAYMERPILAHRETWAPYGRGR